MTIMLFQHRPRLFVRVSKATSPSFRAVAQVFLVPNTSSPVHTKDITTQELSYRVDCPNLYLVVVTVTTPDASGVDVTVQARIEPGRDRPVRPNEPCHWDEETTRATSAQPGDVTIDLTTEK